jgi:hypothetical protein
VGPGSARGDASHRRSESADEPRLREGLQRGQGGRVAQERDANGGSDRSRHLLPRPRAGGMESHLACAGGEPRARCRRQRPLVRVGQPGSRGRRDRLLERQGVLERLAADFGDPRGCDGRQPGDRPRSDLAAAVRSVDGAVPDRRSSPPASATRRVTAASAGPSRGRHRASSAPTTSPSAPSATGPAPRGASTASPTRSRRSSTRGFGLGSTSGRRTSRGGARRESRSMGAAQLLPAPSLRGRGRGAATRRPSAVLESARWRRPRSTSKSRRDGQPACVKARATAAVRVCTPSLS